MDGAVCWFVVLFIVNVVLLVRVVRLRDRIASAAARLEALEKLEARVTWLERRMGRLESGALQEELRAPPADVRSDEVAPPAAASADDYLPVASSPADDAPAPIDWAAPARAVSPDADLADLAEPPAPEPGAAFPHAAVAASPAAPVEVPEPVEPKDDGISLEQWLGERAFALAGAVVLAIAAVFFLRFSVEHGLLRPLPRVALGAVAGATCLVVYERRLRTMHRLLGELVAGAGIAILYLSFWAGRVLYELYGSAVAGAAFVAVTATAAVLAYVRDARVIGGFGLVAGLLTPVLLSTGRDRPIALFGYLLLLDGAFLLLARTRRMHELALLALAGTAFYQLGWIGTRLDGPRVAFAVGMLLVFAAAFQLAMRSAETATSALVRGIAGGLPLVVGLGLALSRELSADLLPLATLTLAVTGGGLALRASPGLSFLAPLGTLATAAVVVLHLGTHDSTARRELLAAVTFLTLLALHAIAEWRSARRGTEAPSVPAGGDAAAVGPDPTPVPAPSDTFDAGLPFAIPVVLAASVLTSLRQEIGVLALGLVTAGATVATAYAALRRAHGLVVASAAALTSLAWFVAHAAHARAAGYPAATVYLVVGLGHAVASLVLALRLARVAAPAAARPAAHGAAIAAVAVLLDVVCLVVQRDASHLAYGVRVASVFVLLSASAALLRHGGYLLVAGSLTFVTHLVFEAICDGRDASMATTLVLSGLVVAAVPLLTGPAGRAHPSTFRAASMAGPALLLPLLVRFHELSHPARGAVAVALALYGLVPLAIARSTLPASTPLRTSALAWTSASVLTLTVIAVPLALRDAWWTVGWALQALVVTELHVRLRHDGLRNVALALFAAVFVRLALNPAVLDYHEVGRVPVFNWLAYTYLVPIACMILAARRAAPLEAQAQAEGKKPLPLVALVGAAAVVLGFVYLNLTVFDAYAPARALEIDFERRPARDLTLSGVWALYAGVLLAVGMAGRIVALRYASLVLFVATFIKVFLYDVGALDDLYRVASLVGLALSLMTVSFVYRRFVFGRGGSPT